MKARLAEAQRIVDSVMAGGGALIDQYALSYASLEIDREHSLGEGAFGTVFKGTLRGETTVAVKTMRVEKVTEAVMSKFKGEVLASALSTYQLSIATAFRLSTCFSDQHIQSTRAIISISR